MTVVEVASAGSVEARTVATADDGGEDDSDDPAQLEAASPKHKVVAINHHFAWPPLLIRGSLTRAGATDASKFPVS